MLHKGKVQLQASFPVRRQVLLGFSTIYFGGLNFSELNSFIILFFSHCDSTKVQELLTDENLNERTETGHNLLHIACISGGNVYRFNLSQSMMKSTKWPVHSENTQISLGTDQPGHLPSLIRVFAVLLKKVCVLSYPLSSH